MQIPVTVNRGSTGESGLRLQLVGSGALVDGSDARAVTDENGRGSFVFPVGSRAGTFNLTLAGNVPVGGSRAVTIRVAPGAPARVATSPDPLALRDENTPGLVRVVVQDRFGNAVADVPLEMRAGSESGTALASGRTSTEGALEFEVVASLLGGENQLVFLSGGQVLGSSGVARPAAAVARPRQKRRGSFLGRERPGESGDGPHGRPGPGQHDGDDGPAWYRDHGDGRG